MTPLQFVSAHVDPARGLDLKISATHKADAEALFDLFAVDLEVRQKLDLGPSPRGAHRIGAHLAAASRRELKPLSVYVDADGECYLIQTLIREMKSGRLWIGEEIVVDRVGAHALTFGAALEALKRGSRIARAGWNGKGMWLALSGDGVRHIPAAQFWSRHNAEFAASCPDGTAPVLPCITMKTADGSILMGWLASQTDMLAEDWQLVD